MRIVFYSVSTTLYGAPTSLLNLIQGLSKGHSDLRLFVIVPSEGPLVHELRKLPITVVKLPFYKWTYSRSIYNRKRNLGKLIAWSWLAKNVLTKFLLNLFFLPFHLVKIRSLYPDLIYTNSSLSPMGVIVSKFLGVRSLWHHRETLNDPETNFFLEWNSSLALKVLNLPDVHLYPSQYLKATYDSFVSEGDSFVIYNGVEKAEGRSDTVVPPRDRIIFGMVGRINRQKGQSEVIDLINELEYPDLYLNLYGSGERSYVEDMKRLAGNNINFRGFQSKAVMYREIDFLVINAKNESFGRVVAEAYAYGVPVIALRSGALPELVDDGETGYLFSDPEELKGMVSRLRTVVYDSSYLQMRERCLQKYANQFTKEAYSTGIMRIVRSHLQQGTTLHPARLL